MAVVRVEADITGIGGGPGYTRMHFEVGDPSSGSTEMDFVEANYALFWETLSDLMSTAVTVTPRPEALIINPASGQVTGVTAVSIAPVTGNEADEQLPWSTQGLIRLRTGVYSGGREARGRVFIPGITELWSAGGAPVSGAITTMTAAAEALSVEGSATPVVISKGQAVPVSTVSAWGRWAVLRSRRD